MKKLLKEEFENDPIYRLAILNGLEDSLFTENILSMHKEISYSTVEAGRIIERSDSTIRNHFRSDLIEYIAPEKFGKYYRLNYKSVFRLHLIFLLMEKASKTTVDLLAELGMQPSIQIGGNIKRIPRSNSRELQEWNQQKEEDQDLIEDRLKNLEHAMNIQSLMLNILKYEKDLADIERKIENRESAINQIKSEFHMRYLEEKQSQLLTNSLKKTIQKPSFFGLFKKTEEIDVQQISKQIEDNLKEKFDREVQSKIKEHQDEIEKLKAEKEKINTSLLEEKEKFSRIQLESTNSPDTKLISNPS
ncbi:hypothetical protein [Bacillus methanolicus]|uniref:hypothetical protein n=1 Tax=Bacillus methanolicus TaxID=1471 RepID=UPI00238073EF|nr:hypothetical protein [Bacillus methanolicus]